MVFWLKTKALISCLGALMTVEVKYYLIAHSRLHLKPAPAQEEPFVSCLLYVFETVRDCVMLCFTDESINYVNCVWSFPPFLTAQQLHQENMWRADPWSEGQPCLMLMQCMSVVHCDLVNYSWRACQREVVKVTDSANFSCAARTRSRGIFNF